MVTTSSSTNLDRDGGQDHEQPKVNGSHEPSSGEQEGFDPDLDTPKTCPTGRKLS